MSYVTSVPKWFLIFKSSFSIIGKFSYGFLSTKVYVKKIDGHGWRTGGKNWVIFGHFSTFFTMSYVRLAQKRFDAAFALMQLLSNHINMADPLVHVVAEDMTASRHIKRDQKRVEYIMKNNALPSINWT